VPLRISPLGDGPFEELDLLDEHVISNAVGQHRDMR